MPTLKTHSLCRTPSGLNTMNAQMISMAVLQYLISTIWYLKKLHLILVREYKMMQHLHANGDPFHYSLVWLSRKILLDSAIALHWKDCQDEDSIALLVVDLPSQQLASLIDGMHSGISCHRQVQRPELLGTACQYQDRTVVLAQLETCAFEVMTGNIIYKIN